MRKSILILLFALLGILSARAQDFEVDGVTYHITNSEEQEVEVWRGNPSYYSFYIPSTVTYSGTTYTVTSIRDEAFMSYKRLTSVTIPNSVTSIGVGAFAQCSNLTSVTMGEGVTTIGQNAFFGTAIRNPLYNSKIFAYMPTDYRGEYTIPSGIQLIATSAFSNCKDLTSVTIPRSVTTIGDLAFWFCTGLTSITIPYGVDIIGIFAFYGCRGLTSVTIPTSVTSIEYGAFYTCSGLTSVIIPYGVTSIGDWAFAQCKGLISATISNSVNTIGYATFANCTGLTSVAIPNSVTSIGDFAFYECSGLTSITIPRSVTTIGDGAFAWCSGLTSITIPNSVDTIGDGTFYECTSLTSVTIGEGVTTIGDSAFYECSSLTMVTVPNSVTSIGVGAFANCTDLTSITLSKGLDTIGQYAFSGCDKLLSVTSLSKTPPYCVSDGDDYVFSFYEGTLFVPRGCKMAYQTAPEWYKFSKIEELSSAGTATVTVQPNNAAMGTVTGGGEYKEGEQAMLAAIPYPGHYFVKWDDGNTNNPRILAVSGDTTITAIFAKNGDNPTANENSEAENFRVYVQNRTIYLSEDRGLVQVYNMAGQCVYNGHATAIPVQQPGVYILVSNNKRIKVLVK